MRELCLPVIFVSGGRLEEGDFVSTRQNGAVKQNEDVNELPGPLRRSLELPFQFTGIRRPRKISGEIVLMVVRTTR